MNALKRTAGWVLVAIGAFFTAAAIVDLATGQAGSDDPVEPGVLVGLAVAFAIVAVAGWRLTRDAGGEPREPHDAEHLVLEAARAAGGRITVAEVALRCGLSVERSRAVLERLVAQGVAEPWVTPDGDIVHVFGGLMADAEKLEARDPLGL